VLTAHAGHLRERIAHAPSYTALAQRVDSFLTELRVANRLLAARAASLGARLQRRSAVARFDAARSDSSAAVNLPADLVTALAEDCRTCGTRLCELVQAARVACDVRCAQVAYSLLRTLEKQLWLLSPHSEGSSHPFPLATARA
jgi:DNA-binding ferritin-like protein